MKKANQLNSSGPRSNAHPFRMGWWPYRIGITVAALVVLLCFAIAIWKVPKYQVENWASKQTAQNAISIKDQADLEDKFRKTLVQILGGVIAGITALLTALNALKKRFDISQDTVFMERFVRAVDQLGATDENGLKKLEIRIGGIYALERVAWDSPSDHGPIMEILTAYLREHAIGKGKETLSKEVQTSSAGSIQPQSDIQAILTVIRRRRHLEEESREQVLNFSDTDIEKANLAGAHLDGADFSNTNLELANLAEATLRETQFIGALLPQASLVNVDAGGANFGEANLMGAGLRGANLAKASFRSADLQGANLMDAQLNEANLIKANLHRATFMRAQLKKAELIQADLQETYLFGADMRMTNLKNANLDKAYLMESDLQGANFSQATLKGANLAKAKLQGALNLTVEQISAVKTLFQAQLDPELLSEIGKSYPHLLRKPE